MSKRRYPTSATFTLDFHEEFEAETLELLRQRLLWLTGLVGAAALVGWVWGIVSYLVGGSFNGELGRFALFAVYGALAAGAYLGTFFVVRGGLRSREQLWDLTHWLVVFDGSLRIVFHAAGISSALGVPGVVIAHTLASIVLPWKASRAVKAIVPILMVYAVTLVIRAWLGRLPIDGAITRVLLSPLVGVPGCLVCWMKHSRRVEDFKLRFLQQRYGEIRHELLSARQIHESLFPKPITDGAVRFAYRYEPMRHIGGDFLYACRAPGDRLNLVVLDVTGHGIAAALTVNRLHGELERVFAENPEASPGEVLRLLNKYVYLTLATHSVYVTAMCLRVDPARDVLEYASGGHPPAFLRAVDGTVEDLPSTAFVLGACSDEAFDPDEKTVRFAPGDTLIAYTDGALEVRNKSGRMLGTAGMRHFIAAPATSPAPGWADYVLAAVARHRNGQALDDTLVIEITRDVATEPTRREEDRRKTRTARAVG